MKFINSNMFDEGVDTIEISIKADFDAGSS